MRREGLVFLVLLLSVPLAVAQHWDIEQVDSAGWGRDVRMRWHPDGRLFLCYTDTSGRIRLASRDSVWSYDSVTGTSGYYGVGFSISTQGQVGVSWLNPDYPWQVILASRSGSSWDYDSTGLMVTGPGPALLAYDTAGNPTVVYTCEDRAYCGVVRARAIDSLWGADTILEAVGSGSASTFYCYEYLISSRDSASLLCVFADAYSGPGLARPWFIQMLCVVVESADTWVSTPKAFGANTFLGAEAMALDLLGAPQACWRDTLPMFRYEGTALDTQAYFSSVIIDGLNRPCVAYTSPELIFTYRSGSQWRPSVVSLATNSASFVSLAIGDDGEPLIAFSTEDGLWLAHGVDIVGQSEESQEPIAHSVRLTALVIRNVLDLPVSTRTSSTALFDMTGRQVADLRPGANDVSGLSPGVYFVREAQAQAQAQAVRKVIITR